MTNKATRENILSEANKIIHGDRQKDYGPPVKNFTDIATGWSVIFGATVTPVQVALAMDWLKTCRMLNGSGSRDSLVDKAGYTAIVAQLAGIDD